MSESVVQHPYRGHTITIRVVEAAPAQWTWSYSIDGIGYKDYGVRPNTGYDEMLNAAIDEGKRRIDAFEERLQGGASA
jgi:hypothetical protein